MLIGSKLLTAERWRIEEVFFKDGSGSRKDGLRGHAEELPVTLVLVYACGCQVKGVAVAVVTVVTVVELKLRQCDRVRSKSPV